MLHIPVLFAFEWLCWAVLSRFYDTSFRFLLFIHQVMSYAATLLYFLHAIFSAYRWRRSKVNWKATHPIRKDEQDQCGRSQTTVDSSLDHFLKLYFSCFGYQREFNKWSDWISGRGKAHYWSWLLMGLNHWSE